MEVLAIASVQFWKRGEGSLVRLSSREFGKTKEFAIEKTPYRYSGKERGRSHRKLILRERFSTGERLPKGK